MKIYKKGKRTIGRSLKGSFKGITLNDVGGGHCVSCGKLYQFDLEAVKVGMFIDPSKMAQHKELCRKCMENKK